MPEVSKADAIVDATMALTRVLKGETESNIGEESIDQLRCLVDAISNTGTLKQDACAVQKSDTISMTH